MTEALHSDSKVSKLLVCANTAAWKAVHRVFVCYILCMYCILRICGRNSDCFAASMTDMGQQAQICHASNTTGQVLQHVEVTSAQENYVHMTVRG